jgi:hypothetical protein
MVVENEPEGWDDGQEPLMSDDEFEREVALAAEGKGELFEPVSIEDFKNG